MDAEGNPVNAEGNTVENADDAYLSAIGLGYQSEEDPVHHVELRPSSETSFKDSVVYSPLPDEVVQPHQPPVGVRGGGRGRGGNRGRKRGRGRGRGGTARGEGKVTA